MDETADKEFIDEAWWTSESDMGRVLADTQRVLKHDIAPLEKLRDMLVGPHFGGAAGDPDLRKPRNNVYGLLTRLYPTAMGGELKCVVDTDFGAPEEPQQLELEQGVNDSWARGNGQAAAELVFTDMLCGYGGMYIEMADSSIKIRESERAELYMPLGRKARDQGAPTTQTPMTDADPLAPRVHYLPPDSWGWDRRAFTMDQAEFYFFNQTFDLSTLIAQARKENEDADGDGPWRLDELRTIRDTLHDANSKAKIGGLHGSGSRKPGDEPERERITLTNMLVMTAEIEGEERPAHHNGVMYTLWQSSNEAATCTWVKDPHYTMCPPWGPFQLFKQHMSGVDSAPYSVLTANMTKVIANEKMHEVAARKIRNHKRNPVFNANQKENINRLENAPDGEPVGFKANGQEALAYFDVQRGGLDQQTIAGIEYYDQQLALDLGMGGASRGAPQGGVTATADVLADEQSDARANQFNDAFNQGIAGVFRTIGWFIAHSDRYFSRSDFQTRAAYHEREILKDRARARAMIEQGLEDDRLTLDASITDTEARAAAYKAARESSSRINGGDFAHSDELDFSAVRFRVNTYLQRYRSPEIKRQESAQFRMQLMEILQLAETLPTYDWVSELRQLEEDYGRRGIVARFNADIAQLRAQVRIETGNTEATPGPSMGGGTQQQPGGRAPRAIAQSVQPRQDQQNLAASVPQ